jgi:anti-sigma regulatory factor (Ser/Thr protein kinase)
MTGSASGSVKTEQREVIELSFPADVDLVVLARFTAAAVAARAGFDVEEIEDLRLAVDELCVSFGPIEESESVRLQFMRTDHSVRIVCEFERPNPPVGDQVAFHTDGLNSQRADDLSRQLLDALVDEHGRDDRDQKPCAWLEKRGGVFAA